MSDENNAAESEASPASPTPPPPAEPTAVEPTADESTPADYAFVAGLALGTLARVRKLLNALSSEAFGDNFAEMVAVEQEIDKLFATKGLF